MAEIMARTATISDCGSYRYRLGRRWADGGRTLAYVMFNPSTADADVDDATIRRCIGFAKAHDFNALEVVNLFASRARDPKVLRAAGYPVGPDNDRHIIEVCTQADAVCLAYGPLAAGLERPQVVLSMLRGLGVKLQCLHITRSGYPGHPLMLPKTCRLMPFTNEAVQAAMRAQHG